MPSMGASELSVPRIHPPSAGAKVLQHGVEGPMSRIVLSGPRAGEPRPFVTAFKGPFPLTMALGRGESVTMVMYTDLLAAALVDRLPRADTPTSHEVLSELRSRRRHLSDISSHDGRGWAPDAVADQLAYDVALMDLSRLLGIECDVLRFDQPQQERARLERELDSGGIRLESGSPHVPGDPVALETSTREERDIAADGLAQAEGAPPGSDGGERYPRAQASARFSVTRRTPPGL